MSQSLSDDTLRKILLQIQQSAVTANRNLNATKAQIAGRERERRIVQLTVKEISDMGSDVNAYKGVGKAFLQVPKPTMEKELRTQEKELTDDIENLHKKEKFLQKQYDEAQGQLKDIFQSSKRT